jgi:hypothetical protein
MKSEKSSDAILTFFCRQKNNVIAQKNVCRTLRKNVQFFVASVHSSILPCTFAELVWP